MNHPDRDLTRADWRKSSHSGSGDQCVEVATLSAHRHAVRDSKDPHGPALMFTPAEWRTFLDTLRRT
ncbi:DUF397 domain-containing protein [Actinomadura viridis]|uniref:DUF397 domain-containing protein n=1 Tax=Actinomadura viridis TaxID=58110 RepID=A0A931DRZ3_9ACTN|nr:DUF397 domain-containing protein [Actinomadura viridis]MBG6091613.1 hypothetical protein [Actinomadura viridis]